MTCPAFRCEHVVEFQAEFLHQSDDGGVRGVDELAAALGNLALRERLAFRQAAPAETIGALVQRDLDAGLAQCMGRT